MSLREAWNESPFNPKNWGGGGSTTTAPKDDFDDSNEGFRSYTGGFTDDITMGAISFGSSYESAAEKLEEAGYSPSAIADFQARTKATQEANRPPPPTDDNYARPAPKPEPEEEEEEAVAEEEATPIEEKTDEIQELADVITGKTEQTESAGPAEDEAREFEKKGRRETVLTSMQGLQDGSVLTIEDLKKLRERRSLLAG